MDKFRLLHIYSLYFLFDFGFGYFVCLLLFCFKMVAMSIVFLF